MKNQRRSIKNKEKKMKTQQNRTKTRRMKGGIGGIAPFNLQDSRYVIPFNTYTGVRGADPIAPANVVNARNFNLVGGSKKRRRNKNRRNRRKSQRGGGLTYARLEDIPDFFLGSRHNMTPVTAFGSTGSGVAYTQRELTGVGNMDGPNIRPDLGIGTKALA
jgi:hypothetical protein